MPWIQFSLAVDQDRVSLMEATLQEAGALAVTLSDAADEPLLEPFPGTPSLWKRVQIRALFPDRPQTLATLKTLTQTLDQGIGDKPRLERIQDQVWERLWLEDFRPIRFGRRLWVCPKGQSPSDTRAIAVELDPGLAFGTGHHATTALCLRWLDAADIAHKRLIDYGCGSGILAIAALRLGADTALAVDLDPQALEATRSNAAHNRVSGRLQTCLPDDMPEGPADLLVANILAGTLAPLAPRMARLVRPGGRIALCGILDEQRGPIEAAYAPWFELAIPVIEQEWLLLSGRRR